MRVFHELTTECDITTQLYAYGYEKKEIAEMKFRASSTINNQLQTSFIILGVRNGRELARKFYSRLSSLGVSVDYKPQVKSFISCCLLFLVITSMFNQIEYQRPARTRTNNSVRAYGRKQ